MKALASSTLHFAEEGFVSRQTHLSDETYGAMLDNGVLACVDVAVVYGSRVFLGKRAQEPHKDRWWICGGKMNTGESPEQTAGRIVNREVGLDVSDLSRFVSLGLNVSFVWACREQSPQEHGCHMLGMYYFVEMTGDEYHQRDLLVATGFSAWEWFDLVQVANEQTFSSLHSVMKHVATRILMIQYESEKQV